VNIIYSLGQLREVAAALWKAVSDARVIALHGDIGSGKTTLISALCKARHVADVVASPTFSLINEYFFVENGLTKKIFHIDLYRVADEREARAAGVEDCLYSDHICLVEWPEKIPNLLPAETLHVYIEVTGPETRKLTLGDN
jgi:tRNA threonylcarbamoyladenosine biosynthesis protein TsaE